MKERKSNLLKILGIGIIVKLSIIIPSGTRIPDMDYASDSQQNLKKSEYMNNYEERGNPNTNHDFYDYFIESF